MGKHRYGLVFDAGSSGTRIYVYRWLNADATRAESDDDELHSLPEVKTKKKWIKKVHPGISTFGEKPSVVGQEHLKELVDFAAEIVPKDEIEHTPIFLLATAGMRLLPERQRAAVLENVCKYFQDNTNFQLPDCDLHVQVIPGETEGLYGWIAANYLLGGFDAPEKHAHGKGHHTYGFLDMGGASAQIAFAPNATEAERHADDLKLLRLRTVAGEQMEHRVFVTTWLGFGANEARKRYVQQLLDTRPGSLEVPDPCLPNGILVKKTGEEIESGSALLGGKEPHLLGTGDFATCLLKTHPLLEKEKECLDPPCLLNGIHAPSIDFDVNHFVGVSEFWHTTHGVFAETNKEKAYDFQTYQKQVTEFCSRDWKDLEKDVSSHKWGKKIDEQTVEEVCFKASWLINVLHDGIGVPRVGLEAGKNGTTNSTSAILDSAKDKGFLDPFQAVDKIDGTEVSWTLGKMVLYASSQMPPAKNALAVGFGSNSKSTVIPTDFQYAGGKYEQLPNDLDDLDHDDDWHDKLFSHGNARRIPGILIFLLILALAVYLLCGRERRLSAYHKLLACLGRKPSTPKPRTRRKPGFSLAGKLFGNGSSEPAYERVLEEAADPDEFELSDVEDEARSSSSSSGGGGGAGGASHSEANAARNGRTSGITTPALRSLSPDVVRASPKNKGYFDSVVGGGSGAGAQGLGITPFERGGLMSRSESKEHLAPVRETGGRSRRSSPTRKSPLTPFKESLD